MIALSDNDAPIPVEVAAIEELEHRVSEAISARYEHKAMNLRARSIQSHLADLITGRPELS